MLIDAAVLNRVCSRSESILWVKSFFEQTLFKKGKGEAVTKFHITDPDKIELQYRILKKIDESGLSYTEFAARFGVSTMQLYNWRKLVYFPEIAFRRKLAAFFGTDDDFLLKSEKVNPRSDFRQSEGNFDLVKFGRRIALRRYLESKYGVGRKSDR